MIKYESETAYEICRLHRIEEVEEHMVSMSCLSNFKMRFLKRILINLIIFAWWYSVGSALCMGSQSVIKRSWAVRSSEVEDNFKGHLMETDRAYSEEAQCKKD